MHSAGDLLRPQRLNDGAGTLRHCTSAKRWLSSIIAPVIDYGLNSGELLRQRAASRRTRDQQDADRILAVTLFDFGWRVGVIPVTLPVNRNTGAQPLQAHRSIKTHIPIQDKNPGLACLMRPAPPVASLLPSV